MNKKITPYIYIVFFSFISTTIYGQETSAYQLKITSVFKLENSHISSIKYKQVFNSEKSLKKTKDSVLIILKEKGFYTITQDSLVIKQKQFTYFVNLGKKITSAVLKINPKDQPLLESFNFNIEKNYLTLKIAELKNTISLINDKFVNTGQSFSQVNLSNILISNSKLFATLNIKSSKKRRIDKIIVKGYPDFPKSFLKNYFNSSSHKTVNSRLIEELSDKTNQLDFIKEIKKPEILFSNDSTIVYLYIDKAKANYFDGLVNFNSENKKIKFRGYFDLHLNNTFNKGEEINIHWKNNGNNKQEFHLSSSIPYFFNTKISPSVSFNIYKHDSTYINTKASLAILYPLNNNLSIRFSTENESSQISNSIADIKNFKKTGLGLGFLYNSPKKDLFNIGFELFYKTRKTEETKSLYQIDINTLSILKFSKKISFFIKNTSKLTSSETNLDNELFRSGGMNSIRGFQENAILSNSYSFINSELQLNLKNNTSLFSIHDIGIFNINNHNKTLSSIGLGYRFKKRNNKFSLEYIIGSTTANNVVESSMISIKILTLF